MNYLIKNKKTIGIILVLLIVIILSLILYRSEGINKLNKNNTESIFVEESEENTGTDSNNEITKENESKEVKSSSISEKIVVEIKGEVKVPDVYTLDKDSIVKDLIDIAGGLTEEADLTSINRAKQLQNHELVYIANKNEQVNTANTTPKNAVSSVSSSNLININTASVDELKEINGVGDAKAKTIIEYREKNGGFNSIEDLKNVTGIGDKIFEKMKDQITI